MYKKGKKKHKPRRRVQVGFQSPLLPLCLMSILADGSCWRGVPPKSVPRCCPEVIAPNCTAPVPQVVVIPIVWQKKKAEAALVMNAAEAAVKVRPEGLVALCADVWEQHAVEVASVQGACVGTQDDSLRPSKQYLPTPQVCTGQCALPPALHGTSAPLAPACTAPPQALREAGVKADIDSTTELTPGQKMRAWWVGQGHAGCQGVFAPTRSRSRTVGWATPWQQALGDGLEPYTMQPAALCSGSVHAFARPACPPPVRPGAPSCCPPMNVCPGGEPW